MRFRSPRRSIAAVALLPFVTLGAALMAPASAQAASTCTPIFVGVMGSGQNTDAPSSREVHAVGATVQAALGGEVRLKYLDYPAVPWYRYAAGKWDYYWNELGVSEAAGEQSLLTLVQGMAKADARRGCRPQPIMLAGYSQGAEVVIRSADALPGDLQGRTSIALLGNPSFWPGKGYNLNLNTEVHRGIRPSLLARQRYSPSAALASRTLDICAASDPICSFQVSNLPGLIGTRSAHYHYADLQYGTNTLTAVAGNFLASKLTTAVSDVSQLSVTWIANPQWTVDPPGVPDRYYHVYSKFEVRSAADFQINPNTGFPSLLLYAQTDPVADSGLPGGLTLTQISGDARDAIYEYSTGFPVDGFPTYPVGTYTINRVCLSLSPSAESCRAASPTEAVSFVYPAA